MRKYFSLLMLFATLSLSGCGYNTFQTADEKVKAAWAEVLNQSPTAHREAETAKAHRG